MQTARIVRGQVLTIRARAGPIIVRPEPDPGAATLDIAQAIITESALSFLGLGPPAR